MEEIFSHTQNTLNCVRGCANVYHLKEGMMIKIHESKRSCIYVKIIKNLRKVHRNTFLVQIMLKLA